MINMRLAGAGSSATSSSLLLVDTEATAADRRLLGGRALACGDDVEDRLQAEGGDRLGSRRKSANRLTVAFVVARVRDNRWCFARFG